MSPDRFSLSCLRVLASVAILAVLVHGCADSGDEPGSDLAGTSADTTGDALGDVAANGDIGGGESLDTSNGEEEGESRDAFVGMADAESDVERDDSSLDAGPDSSDTRGSDSLPSDDADTDLADADRLEDVDSETDPGDAPDADSEVLSEPMSWVEYEATEEYDLVSPTCPDRPIACPTRRGPYGSGKALLEDPWSQFHALSIEPVESSSLLRIRAVWQNTVQSWKLALCQSVRSDVLPSGWGTWLLNPETATLELESYEVYPGSFFIPPDPVFEPSAELEAAYPFDLFSAALPEGPYGPPALVGSVDFDEGTVELWGQSVLHEDLASFSGPVRIVLDGGSALVPAVPISSCLVPMAELVRTHCYCNEEPTYPFEVGEFLPAALDDSQDYFYFEAMGRPFGVVLDPKELEYASWQGEGNLDPMTTPYSYVSIGAAAYLGLPTRTRLNWVNGTLTLPLAEVGEESVLMTGDDFPAGYLAFGLDFQDGHQRGQFDTHADYDAFVGIPRFVAFPQYTGGLTTWLSMTVTYRDECRIQGTFFGEVVLQPTWPMTTWTDPLGPPVAVTNGHFRGTRPECFDPPQ